MMQQRTNCGRTGNETTSKLIAQTKKTIAEFPAVTICNENKLKSSKLRGTPYESILSLQQKYYMEVYGPNEDTNQSSGPSGPTSGSSNDTDAARNDTNLASGPVNDTNPASGPMNDTNPTSGPANDTNPASAPANDTNPASGPGNDTNQTSAVTSNDKGASTIAPNDQRGGPARLKRAAPQPGQEGSEDFRVPEGSRSTYNILHMRLANDHDYETLFESSSTSDFSDVASMLQPSMEDLDKYGHQFEDFVLQCTFDGENCTDVDFKKVYNDVYGNCYTFNYQGDNHDPRQTTKIGSQYGLKLSLNIERQEYLGLFAHQYGARITVHPGNITAFPQDHSVSVPVGYLASVAVDMEVVDSEESPYETNCTTGTDRELFYDGLYSIDNCLNSCLRKMVKETCGCVENVNVLQNETRCEISNSTQVKCRLTVYTDFRNNTFPCQRLCNEACNEVVYKTTTSYAEWPTDGFDALVGKQLVGKIGSSELRTYISKNILRVNVFFRTLMYSHQEAFPTYTWETLLSNIGGTWGLFVGFSVCTFLEGFEYLVELLIIACRLACRKPQERVSPESFSYSKTM